MPRVTLVAVFVYLLAGCNESRNNTENVIFEPVQSNITFYKQKPPKDGVQFQLQALFNGKLISKNNCLLLESQGGYYNPIWPHDVSLSLANGTISVVRGNKVLLKMDQLITIGGGEIGVREDLVKAYRVPNECKFTFWLVGEILDES